MRLPSIKVSHPSLILASFIMSGILSASFVSSFSRPLSSSRSLTLLRVASSRSSSSSSSSGGSTVERQIGRTASLTVNQYHATSCRLLRTSSGHHQYDSARRTLTASASVRLFSSSSNEDKGQVEAPLLLDPKGMFSCLVFVLVQLCGWAVDRCIIR
jgi:hypothetical protein